jgi:hypothetical protein
MMAFSREWDRAVDEFSCPKKQAPGCSLLWQAVRHIRDHSTYDPSFEAPKPSAYRNACSAGVVSRLSARFRWGNRPESLNNVSMLRRVAQLLGLT